MPSSITSPRFLLLAGLFSSLALSSAIPGADLFPRQAGTCGVGKAKCSGSEPCCSQWGWCGASTAHCGSGCQPAYGTCTGGSQPSPTSSSTPPSSTSPSTGGRSRPGSVPYGSMIYSCTVPGVVALTFDDGPYIYTTNLLDRLKAVGAHATFFVNGENWGDLITVPEKQNILKRMVAEGHQIGSHTWDHPSLSSLSTSAMTTEMTRLESAISTAIGKYPTYMRPPYFDCNSACLGVMNTLAYHVVHANLDTLDYANTQNIQKSKDIFSDGVTSSSLVLAHDVHQTTVEQLAEYMVSVVAAKGYRTATVGECLGDPVENWYRT